MGCVLHWIERGKGEEGEGREGGGKEEGEEEGREGEGRETVILIKLEFSFSFTIYTYSMTCAHKFFAHKKFCPSKITIIIR